MDWATVRAFLRATYKLLDDTHGGVALSWSFPSDDGEIIQRQTVRPVVARGAAHITIASPVDSPFTPTDALRHNATLAIGALALVEDALVMQAVLPLDSITFPGLRRALELVAHEAARLRAQSVGSNPLLT